MMDMGEVDMSQKEPFHQHSSLHLALAPPLCLEKPSLSIWKGQHTSSAERMPLVVQGFKRIATVDGGTWTLRLESSQNL